MCCRRREGRGEREKGGEEGGGTKDSADSAGWTVLYAGGEPLSQTESQTESQTDGWLQRVRRRRARQRGRLLIALNALSRPPRIPPCIPVALTLPLPCPYPGQYPVLTPWPLLPPSQAAPSTRPLRACVRVITRFPALSSPVSSSALTDHAPPPPHRSPSPVIRSPMDQFLFRHLALPSARPGRTCSRLSGQLSKGER